MRAQICRLVEMHCFCAMVIKNHDTQKHVSVSGNNIHMCSKQAPTHAPHATTEAHSALTAHHPIQCYCYSLCCSLLMHRMLKVVSYSVLMTQMVLKVSRLVN